MEFEIQAIPEPLLEGLSAIPDIGEMRAGELCKELKSMGVDSVTDLQYMHDEDLIPHLTRLRARKAMAHWNKGIF